MRSPLARQASIWLYTYLAHARHQRALEQSVLAEGRRRGFTDRQLFRAKRLLPVRVVAGCWELRREQR